MQPALGDSASSTSGTAVLSWPVCHCPETTRPLNVNNGLEGSLLSEASLGALPFPRLPPALVSELSKQQQPTYLRAAPAPSRRQRAGEAPAGGASTDGAGTGGWSQAGRVLCRHKELGGVRGGAAARGRGLPGPPCPTPGCPHRACPCLSMIATLLLFTGINDVYS